jgi:hypothetical protein
MNWRREVAKTAASDEPSVYPVVMFEQDRDAPRQALQHRMNRRLGQGEASVYPTVMKEPTETVWREVLQHRMN